MSLSTVVHAESPGIQKAGAGEARPLGQTELYSESLALISYFKTKKEGKEGKKKEGEEG